MEVCIKGDDVIVLIGSLCVIDCITSCIDLLIYTQSL